MQLLCFSLAACCFSLSKHRWKTKVLASINPKILLLVPPKRPINIANFAAATRKLTATGSLEDRDAGVRVNGKRLHLQKVATGWETDAPPVETR